MSTLRVLPCLAFASCTTGVPGGAADVVTVARQDPIDWIPTWTPLTPAAGPDARGEAPLAGDAASKQLVLFGSLGKGAALSDTWLWAGSSWTQATPSLGPAPRGAHALAHDTVCQAVVLSGGGDETGNVFQDTWLWDGASWMTPQVPGPTGRSHAAAAFGEKRGQLVLFGGRGPGPGGTVLGDTCLWNGSGWTQATASTAPSPRWGATMAYDPTNVSVVLFGGAGGGTGNDPDTWVWGGTGWTRATPTVSPPRCGQTPRSHSTPDSARCCCSEGAWGRAMRTSGPASWETRGPGTGWTGERWGSSLRDCPVRGSPTRQMARG